MRPGGGGVDYGNVPASSIHDIHVAVKTIPANLLEMVDFCCGSCGKLPFLKMQKSLAEILPTLSKCESFLHNL